MKVHRLFVNDYRVATRYKLYLTVSGCPEFEFETDRTILMFCVTDGQTNPNYRKAIIYNF